MLRDQIAGRNDSWAVRWHASCFLAGRLTLYPGKSLVSNVGLDGSGEHCGPDESLTSAVSARPVLVQRQMLCEDKMARSLIASHFLIGTRRKSPLRRLLEQLFPGVK